MDESSRVERADTNALARRFAFGYAFLPVRGGIIVLVAGVTQARRQQRIAAS